MIDFKYFGDIYYYSTFIDLSNVEYCPYKDYQRGLKLNRMRLVGANGPLLLTVPLVGGRAPKQQVKDLQIGYAEPWQRIHWRGIHDNYRKAPWFEEYAPELQLLFQRKDKFLLDLNLNTVEWCLQKLKRKVDILSVDQNQDPQIEALLERLPGEESLPEFPPYQQVFSDRHGFVSNLSILDLLLCEGPLATDYLRRLNNAGA
jgi:hypothetical protein